MAASLLPVSRPRGSTLSTGFQFLGLVEVQYRLLILRLCGSTDFHIIGPAVAVRYFSSGELVTDGDFNS